MSVVVPCAHQYNDPAISPPQGKKTCLVARVQSLARPLVRLPHIAHGQTGFLLPLAAIVTLFGGDSNYHTLRVSHQRTSPTMGQTGGMCATKSNNHLSRSKKMRKEKKQEIAYGTKKL